VRDKLVEGLRVEFNRMAGQQIRTAFATFWLVAQAFIGYAVDCSAVWASKFHRASPLSDVMEMRPQTENASKPVVDSKPLKPICDF
jgi:hypothetical protein